ncbi:Regulator of nonsense transcripts 1-like protein [Orbilia oligospora]|uniref:Regulator of nonsense transcripts 1-like protein n=1 Tax=Orbilia oligospora TaxID=2813651 RepID=A0A7C8JEY3_ORBOL|nr:Regulator of nonsense transcripts 1-like protein [Orbilia oligospora]KAF3117058.1 Regulator of nonsense transcripts 1-like protein [Orbilia oligospora]KAF3153361.1 Regulator of nonsense transcripts 1-like protein [Orbilia oligospora]
MDPKPFTQFYGPAESSSKKNATTSKLPQRSPSSADTAGEISGRAQACKSPDITSLIYATVSHEGKDAPFTIISNTKFAKAPSVEIKYEPSGSNSLDYFLIELGSQALKSFQEDGDYLTFTFDHRAFVNVPERFIDLPHYKIVLNAKKDKKITLLIDTKRECKGSREVLRNHVELLRTGDYTYETQVEESSTPTNQNLHRKHHFSSPLEYYNTHLDDLEADFRQKQALLDELFKAEVFVEWDLVEPAGENIKCTVHFQYRGVPKLEIWEPEDDQIFELSLPLRTGCGKTLKLNLLSDKISESLEKGVLRLVILQKDIDLETIKLINKLRQERVDSVSDASNQRRTSFEYRVKTEPSRTYYDVQKQAFGELMRFLLRPEPQTHIKFDWLFKGREDIAPSIPPNQENLATLRRFELDLFQEEAAARVLYDMVPSGVTLINGPSGTGKSKTIQAVVFTAYQNREKLPILFCCPSEILLQQHLRRLAMTGVQIIYLTSKNLESHSTPCDDGFSEYGIAGNRKRWINTHPTHPLSENLRSILPPNSLNHQDLDPFGGDGDIWEKVDNLIWKDADIVFCTVDMALGKKFNNTFSPKLLILEEAYEVTEGLTLALMLRFRKSLQRCVLVGGLFQNSHRCLRFDSQKVSSMAARLGGSGWNNSKLRYNYRADLKICDFLREYAYNTAAHINKKAVLNNYKYHVESSKDILNRRNLVTPLISEVCKIESPQVWINVLGSEGAIGYGTVCNMVEVQVIQKLVTTLTTAGSVSHHAITVLTPYIGQVGKLRKALRDQILKGLSISTVEDYQGQECDVVIFSLVRSNFSFKIGMLNSNGMIVSALSRARYGNIIIGNHFMMSNLGDPHDYRNHHMKRLVNLKLIPVVDESQCRFS